MDDIDIWTLIVAIVAVIISIWSVKRNEKVNYRTKIFEVVFKELFEKFPLLVNNAIDEHSYTINEDACDIVEDTIGKYRERILVLKYSDNDYYMKIDKQLIKMDEKLTLLAGYRNFTFFNNYYAAFLKEVKKLYKIVRKYIS